MIALSPAPHRWPCRTETFNSARRPGSAIATKRAQTEFFRQASPALTCDFPVRATTDTVARGHSKSIVRSPDRTVCTEGTSTAYRRAPHSLVVTQWNGLRITNHKTAADAIHTAPQKSGKNAGQHHRGARIRRGRSINPPLPGSIWLESFDAETLVHRGSAKEIDKLGARDRTARAQGKKGPHLNGSAGSDLVQPKPQICRQR